MTFRVGQKVCCVRTNVKNDGYTWAGQISPEVGEIYTIRVIISEVLRPHLGVGILLQEIHNPLDASGREYGFYSCRFRPIVSRKTDISIFQRMLNPSPDTVKIQIIADKLAEIYESAVP